MPMNDMDRASVGSALNSTAVGPPVSPVSLMDGFRLRCGRMRGMKAVQQEEEGRLGAGGRPSPVEELPAPTVESSAPAALREGDHGRRPTTTTQLLWPVTSPRPTGERERERESGFVWVGMCGQGHVWER
jgi:hypothetical protein